MGDIADRAQTQQEEQDARDNALLHVFENAANILKNNQRQPQAGTQRMARNVVAGTSGIQRMARTASSSSRTAPTGRGAA